MDLNLFENLKNEICSNINIKSFLEDLANSLNNQTLEQKLQQYRKEGHLYLVTEDRNNKVFLWDLTDKPKTEIEEIDFPRHLLDKATEGTVFQYKNGTYELYSENGYEMLFQEN